MSKEIWKIVETETRKTGVVKTKGRRRRRKSTIDIKRVVKEEKIWDKE